MIGKTDKIYLFKFIQSDNDVLYMKNCFALNLLTNMYFFIIYLLAEKNID